MGGWHYSDYLMLLHVLNWLNENDNMNDLNDIICFTTNKPLSAARDSVFKEYKSKQENDSVSITSSAFASNISSTDLTSSNLDKMDTDNIDIDIDNGNSERLNKNDNHGYMSMDDEIDNMLNGNGDGQSLLSNVSGLINENENTMNNNNDDNHSLYTDISGALFTNNSNNDMNMNEINASSNNDFENDSFSFDMA